MLDAIAEIAVGSRDSGRSARNEQGDSYAYGAASQAWHWNPSTLVELQETTDARARRANGGMLAIEYDDQW